MWKIIKLWITPVLSPMYLLVAGAFGVFLTIVKRLEIKSQKIEILENEVERARRIQDVETNTTRDDALERLRKSGNVRDD